MSQIFVTTALPYANAPFHVGHMMEYIQADIWVRAQRMLGHEVDFVCADDTHGAPIMLAAAAAGKSPQEFVAEIGAGRQPYLDGFHISFDNWSSTDSPTNHDLAQDIYRALRDNDLIATREVEQFFDPDQGMFLPDRYIKGTCPFCGAADQYGDNCEVCGRVYAPTDLVNPYSTVSGATPVLRSSEHFFFKLSDPRCVEFLAEWTQDGRLQPEVANKVKEWFTGEEGLADWDISRDAPYFGIEIPDAPGKYFYVWLDAPIGYLASVVDLLNRRGTDVDAYFANPDLRQYHFIGKDIVTFHTLFWPAMLKFSGRKVPDNIFVHGFLTVKQEKMSKSRGTGLSPMKYLDLGMNPEWLRYYLAAKLSARNEDIDFTAEDFQLRVNSDLVGKYVNIASRASGFLTKRFDGKLGVIADDSATLLTSLADTIPGIAQLYEGREFSKALRETMALADRVNEYVEANKPWELAKAEGAEARLHDVCTTCVEAFRLLTIALKPVLPGLAEQVESWLNAEPFQFSSAGTLLGSGHQIGRYSHLLQRVDAAQLDTLFEVPEPEPEPVAHPGGMAIADTITIDD
ncbi:MAG: methionine--tRNA ligase, partial [Propioniciclava sp.]